jgi:hypothetical protein
MDRQRVRSYLNESEEEEEEEEEEEAPEVLEAGLEVEMEAGEVEQEEKEVEEENEGEDDTFGELQSPSPHAATGFEPFDLELPTPEIVDEEANLAEEEKAVREMQANLQARKRDRRITVKDTAEVEALPMAIASGFVTTDAELEAAHVTAQEKATLASKTLEEEQEELALDEEKETQGPSAVLSPYDPEYKKKLERSRLRKLAMLRASDAAVQTSVLCRGTIIYTVSEYADC